MVRALLAALAGLVTLAPAQTPRIDPERAFRLVERLTAPDFEGRRSGTRSGERAAGFIASELRSYGLDPGGDRGTYLQNYTFPMFDYLGPSRLALVSGGKPREFRYGDDFQIVSVSAGGKVKTAAVFVGYGMSERSFDEYAGVNVRGKIVIAFEGLPRSGAGHWDRSVAQAPSKAETAAKRGAAALLLIPDWERGKALSAERVWSFSKELSQPKVIVARVDSPVAAEIIAPTGHRLDVLKKRLDQALAPVSFVIPGRELVLEANVRVDPKRRTANVLAALPGADPELKRETVIVGGHYDMGGLDPSGEVYAGAQDDASGTALVMEIGRVLAPLRGKLKRTVVLAAWAAEEQGYCGTEHYLAHPTFDPAKTVANFWLDNSGTGDGSFRGNGATVFPEIWDYFSARVAPELRQRAEPLYYVDPWFGPRGIPFFFPHSLGIQGFNHTPWDRPYFISREALGTIGQWTLEAVIALADAPPGIIGRDGVAKFATRATPVFDFTPVAASALARGNNPRFDPATQQNGPVVFFAHLDAGTSGWLDTLAETREKTPVIRGPDVPRSFSGRGASAVVLAADAHALAERPRHKEMWKELGVRALVLDSDVPEIHNSTLAGFLVLVRNLKAEAIERLPAKGALVVVSDAATPGAGSRFAIAELRSLTSRGVLLAVRFPCSLRPSDPALAEAVARDVLALREAAGIDGVVLNAEWSDDKGASLIAVAQTLLARGLDLRDVRKVMGDNFVRAWRQFTRPE